MTGKTVVNRGVFQETFTPIEGTEDFTATVTGFRFMGTFPGEGLVLQDVGRFEESPDGEILFVAGQHDLLPEAAEPAVICAASADQGPYQRGVGQPGGVGWRTHTQGALLL